MDRRITKKQLIIIIIAVVIIALGICAAVIYKNYHIYETKVVAPTCGSKGYTESVCTICGDISRDKFVDALGHDWKDNEVIKPATETAFGESVQVCKRCGRESKNKTEPTSTMKKFYFNGSAFEVDDSRSTTGKITYSYNGKSVEYYVKLQYSRISEASRYTKHDYNITFYKDKQLKETAELKLLDNGLGLSNWNFFGNFYDAYNVRNCVSTELFKQVRKTSKAIDKRLEKNYGTSISEPVLFYVNNTFAGVFRLAVPSGAFTMNVNANNKNCAIVRANYASNASKFKDFDSKNTTWKIRYNSTDNETWINNSINSLTDCVMNKDKKEFKNEITKYLDVDGMIDYMVTVYCSGAADNVSRAFMLQTYDKKIWTPVLYDASASLGMNSYGELGNFEDRLAPEKNKDGAISSGTDSLLWDKMLENYYDEIKAKYNQVKNTVFSVKNVNKIYNQYRSQVPASVYKAEKEMYLPVNYDFNFKKNYSDFSKSRKSILNKFFK